MDPALQPIVALLEAAPDAIIGVAADGHIVMANRRAELLFGYGRGELVGERVEMLVPEAYRQAHEEHRERYLERPSPRPVGHGGELAALRRDGRPFPAEIALTALVDTGDGPLVITVVRDLTNRTGSEAKFRGLVESAPDAMVGVSVSGRIELVNAQAVRLFGYTRQELIGQPVEMLVPESQRAIHPEHRRRYLKDPQQRPMGAGMELAARRKDGSDFPAEISLSSIETEDGLLVSAAIRDVTARQRAEAKFRGLLEAAPDAIVGVTGDGRIALVNAQAERLFGYGRDELLGEQLEILVPEGARALHPKHRAEYFADPLARPMGAGMQLAARRKNGTEFPAEISLGALETEDGVVVSAAIRDITDRLEAQAERERLKAQAERERFEAQLHQSQRLESLGQLAGGVAHDFNNLLAVIINYTSFVAEEVAAAAAATGEGRWEAAARDIAQVERAAQRATQLTHQLLAFGRREVVRPRVLNLNTVVCEVEQLLNRTLGEHVVLRTALAEGLWPVLADPGQIEQVLVNLAVNARDAMQDGGQLTIDTANVDISPDYAAERPGLKAGPHVRMRVSDNGTGIPAEILSRVFEPFFTTKPKGAGSGLGLATVYGIITQAEGHVEITSTPGVGTTFMALLPATEGVPAPAELAPRLAKANRGVRRSWWSRTSRRCAR